MYRLIISEFLQLLVGNMNPTNFASSNSEYHYQVRFEVCFNSFCDATFDVGRDDGLGSWERLYIEISE